MNSQNQTLARLHQETMAALRAEHPDWTEDLVDDYETRFAALLHQLLGRVKHRHPKSTARMV